MDQQKKDTSIEYLGIVLIILGLFLALYYGGNQGFSAGLFHAMAYIGGFVIAFIGAYLAFIWGRTRNRDE